ncbi:tubulin-tyrosine ligase family-domain-containing protein, partial [Lipomyces japonicus]|uniref:tubulin-tyrosine ligase family-domain-containing protein n=1 Tax=Lipomyces japonicus TaxID=56871 RepID=UPI0034CF05D5
MHVLITNDDGPPSKAESPFVTYLVEAIKKHTNWKVSVALPDSQKSWIGKAHFVGKTISASFISPDPTPSYNYEGPYLKRKDNVNSDEWVLLDGTPATCTQIGLHHLFQDKGPVDLVISGPNFGRNSTALFILSSGTVGAAMEGALCGVKSIGLSFAYNTRTLVQEQIETACRVSVKYIKHLYENWPSDNSVDLYSVNVPLNANTTDDSKAKFTHILDNRWGSAFEYTEDTVLTSKTGEPIEITDRLEPNLDQDGRLQFKWMPNLAKVNQEVTQEPEDNDGWALIEGFISVTPLKANFQGVPQYKGFIELLPKTKSEFTAFLSYPKSSYLYPILVSNLQKLPNVRIVYDPQDPAVQDEAGENVFHYADYEDLNFERLVSDSNHYLACSYIYRKALIRKNYLAHSVANYRVKHPNTILGKHFPESYELELDYAEYLDEMLDEIYEFRDQLLEEKSWWILKPAMSDRGQGIRIFHTLEELQEIFDSFENDESDEDDEEDDNDDDEDGKENQVKSFSDGVVTSVMRQFLIQKYIGNPLVLEQYGNRKFHVRTYVVAVGALKVYVYKDMLALFALKDYAPPSEENHDLEVHLTNTCLQGNLQDEGSVRRFWNLQGFDKDAVWKQICDVTGETFKAVVDLGRLHFQPLPNAFEIYGVDFLIDSDLTTSILEVNAYPDFAQTGEELKDVVNGLIESVIGHVVVPFFTTNS